jgi:PPP family 3-phenylpropionic acid transporter
MEDKDAVKGQAFITIAMTLGNLFSSIIGGIFIRAIGVVATLWLGTFITLSGVIVTFYALLKIKKK